MSLSDEMKRRIIEALRNATRSTSRVPMEDVAKFIRDTIDNIPIEPRIERGSGGGHGRFTITVNGLPIDPEIMAKIWREYLKKQRQYYERELVSGTNKDKRTGELTATGQTLGRTGHRDDTDIETSRISFQFPIHPRLGDKKKRTKKARENQWKLPPTQIQRGPRKGQPWKPKNYNEVTVHIEDMKGKSIMLTDLQVIKEIVIDELKKSVR